MKKDRTLWNDGTKTVVASLLSILMGVIFGGVLLFVVALCLKMPLSSAWEGFRIVLGGVFNTGRDYDAGSVLTFGINARLIGDMLFRATPLIMTGLSVALAYKTGLFNIGAPGQYLMGTAVSIIVALAIDTSVVPAFLGEDPRPLPMDCLGVVGAGGIYATAEDLAALAEPVQRLAEAGGVCVIGSRQLVEACGGELESVMTL